jgi:hypothetical protein
MLLTFNIINYIKVKIILVNIPINYYLKQNFSKNKARVLIINYTGCNFYISLNIHVIKLGLFIKTLKIINKASTNYALLLFCINYKRTTLIFNKLTGKIFPIVVIF